MTATSVNYRIGATLSERLLALRLHASGQDADPVEIMETLIELIAQMESLAAALEDATR